MILALILNRFAALAALCVPASTGEQIAFERQFNEIQSQLESGKWRAACDGLNELLEVHAEAPYVLADLLAIQAVARECAFRLEYEEPELDMLISGQLLRYERRSGEARLQYGPGQLDDFQPYEEGSTELMLHPMTFDGAFTVEIEMGEYSAREFPVLFLGIGTEEPLRVIFGMSRNETDRYVQWLPTSIARFDGLRWTSLEKKDSSPVKAGEACRLKVKVQSNSVAVYHNGKKIISAQRPKAPFGHLGFANIANQTSLQEIVIQGDVQPSWFEGLLDQDFQTRWAVFEAEYRPSTALPGWLPEGPSSEAASADAMGGLLGAIENSSKYEEASEFLNAGRWREGLEWVRGLDSGRSSQRSYLLIELSFLRLLERYDEALPIIERLVKTAPDDLAVRILHATLLGEAEGRSRTIAVLQSLKEEFPNSSAVRASLAGALFFGGGLPEAMEEVRLALLEGLDPEPLWQMQATLVRAKRGPLWRRSFEHTSSHYRVSTDVDHDLAFEVANQLEDAYKRYRRDLGHISNLDRRHFQVYVFSGEAGFKAYCDEVFGSKPENIAGLYTPDLKQLLIWNLPDRDTMMRTVRHEGFHQYLDRKTSEAPRWFNEGLAEYYEACRLERGRWKNGLLHPDHAWFLENDAERPSLGEFIHMGSSEFNVNPQLSYAYAWSLVHYLRHGDQETRRVFDRLFGALEEGRTRKSAIDAAFTGVDLVEMEDDFREHLQALQEGQ